MISYDEAMPQIEYFVHRKCTPSWEIETSVTDFIDITYVLKGTAHYFVESKEIRPVAGDLLCFPKGVLRCASSEPSDLMECFSANFTLHAISGDEITLPFPPVSHIGHHPDIITMYKDLNAEWLHRAPGYNMKVRGYFLLILQRFFELLVYKTDSGLVDMRIRKAIRFIAENYAESLTIEQLAQMAGLNPVYFGSLFKQSTGVPFRQYLTAIRLNNAEDMLRSGEFNVGEVAARCGFPDIYYFSRVFKENKGVAPSKL